MKIKKFEDIKSWQLSRELVIEIYNIKANSNFIDYGFKDQIQRAAVSVMSHIAEGFEYKSDKTFIKYLYISKGSSAEVRSLLYLAKDLQYISDDKFKLLSDKCLEISKLIFGLIKYLSEKN
jgi:four helix bundle protein